MTCSRPRNWPSVATTTWVGIASICIADSAGSANAAEMRRRLLLHLRRVLHQVGYNEVAAEADADRSLVVGPAARWIQVGDSAGGTESADPQAFADLAAALSTLAPVIDVQ